MDTDVMLCDHAEAINGKLFINGAAINMFSVGAQVPYVISPHVAAVVHVPYTATNQSHAVTITLIDEDGQPVAAWAPEGAPPQAPVRLEANFSVGRPPQLHPGESQTVPLAMGFQVPLAELGRYEFRIEVDGSEVRRLPFKVEVRS
jgi:hypothetical protein